MRSWNRQRLLLVRVTQRRFHFPARVEPDCKKQDRSVRGTCWLTVGCCRRRSHMLLCHSYLVEISTEHDTRDTLLTHVHFIRRCALHSTVCLEPDNILNNKVVNSAGKGTSDAGWTKAWAPPGVLKAEKSSSSDPESPCKYLMVNGRCHVR